MKNCAAFSIAFTLFSAQLIGQDFISLSKKVPQGVLPYSTSNEFLDVTLFETKNDYIKNGLLQLTENETRLLIDEEFEAETDKYFALHRLQLTPKIIGIVFYKQSKEDIDEENVNSYNYLLTTYSLTGQKLATMDFIGYEWIEMDVPESDEEIAEEENFEEIEEEMEEIAFAEDDTLDMEDYLDVEIISNVLDEGYAYSTILIENNAVWIQRKSVSYYTKENISTTYFKLNISTGEFDETKQ